MKSAASISFVRDLDALYRVGAVGGLGDRELLARFATRPDLDAERAFEALVHRHGPMVWAVCRRAVPDDQTAEDAFQATFLVLALKAGSIRRQESLGPWLHGVAARIARRAGVRASRRAREPRSLASVPARAGEDRVDAAELRAVLDQEIERLPVAYRRAIVLCYLEGKTQEAAALELGWTKGTVSGRLARAKDLLRARLTRRGFAPSAGLAGIVLAGEDARAAVPAQLAREAVRAGLNAALGRSELIAASGSAAALASGTLRAMMLGKLTATIAAIVALMAFASALAQTAARPEHTDEGRTIGKRAVSRPQPAAPGRDASPPAVKRPQQARARLGTTRLRHEFYVASVAFAPDGQVLASTDWEGTVRFWDVRTGEPAAHLPGIEGAGRALSVAYSPDGSRLAFGRDDTLRLRDLRTGQESFRSPPLKGGVREIVFSADGKTLATATQESDPAVRIWDVATGRVRKTLSFDDPSTYRGRPMSFSPDGRRLVVGATAIVGPKKTAEIIGMWDIDSDSRPVVIRDAHGHTLTSLAFGPDGKTLLSGGCDERQSRDQRPPGEKLELSPRIRVWDASTGRPVREFDMGDLVGHCAFAVSRDGRTLTSLHPDRLIVWDVAAARRIRTIPIERYDPGVGIGGCLALSPDGRTCAAARGDHAVHIWDLEAGKPLLQQSDAHEGAVTSLAISPDDHLVATGDGVGVILLWDAARGDYVRRIDMGEHDVIHSVRFAPDGRTLAAAGRYFDPESYRFRGIVRVWQVPNGGMQREFPFEREPLRLAYSPDGRQLAIALREHPNNPPGRVRAVGEDEQIWIHDTATGQRRGVIRGREGATYALAFGGDGRTLAAADADEAFADARFHLWDLPTGRAIREIPIDGHRQGAQSKHPGRPTRLGAVDFAPDLSTAVTGAQLDDRLLVWDLPTGRVRRTFQVGTYEEAVLAVSPDGRLLAGALKSPGGPGRDTTIRVWEIATKREVLRLEPKSGAVRSLAFSRDGKTLVSGMADTTVILWDCSAAYGKPPNPRE